MPLVDLDDPEELRARWCALAAVAHATGFDRRWYADDDGYHHQDETASFLRMVRLDGGRSVLFGFHTQHSRTAGSDLLAGSPDWIGQPEVRRLISAGELGFVYGAFNGTWARASYQGDPWQPLDDGFAPIGQWITSDEEAAVEMIEWVAEWADYLGGLDELVPFGVQLIRSAEITVDVLGEFFDRFGIDPRSPVQPDLPAGVVAAEDFGRNVAVPEMLADEPDTAEVSVVEEVVTGASEGPEDEESYVVPPGISPFTGQPIDDPVGYAEPPAAPPAVAPYVQTPYRAEPARDDNYGVVEKKQGWLRRRKQDDAPEFEPAPPADVFPGGPAPGTYLPEGEIGNGLPYGALPSSEPPRVGGGVHEGEDFYASLFADAPAAAFQQEAPAPADAQDWETAEQPSWSDQDATSEYNPFTDDTAPPPSAPQDHEWVGGAWINGEWVEDPATQAPNAPAQHPEHPAAPSDHAAQSEHHAARPDHDAARPEHDAVRAEHQSPHPDFHPLQSEHHAAQPDFRSPQREREAVQPDLRSPHREPQAVQPDFQSPQREHHADQSDLQSRQREREAFAPEFRSPHPDFQPLHADDQSVQGDPSAVVPSAPEAALDDDAPTAEIAAVIEPDLTDDPNEEDEPASFTGPSPFAPVAPAETPEQAPPARFDEPAARFGNAAGEPPNLAARLDESTPHVSAPAARLNEPAPHLSAPAARLDEPATNRDAPTARFDQQAGGVEERLQHLEESTAHLDRPTDLPAAHSDRPADPPAARNDRPLDAPATRLGQPADHPGQVARGSEPAVRADAPRRGLNPAPEPSAPATYGDSTTEPSETATYARNTAAEPSDSATYGGNTAAGPSASATYVRDSAAEASAPPARPDTPATQAAASRAQSDDSAGELAASSGEFDEFEDDLTAEIPVVADEPSAAGAEAAAPAQPGPEPAVPAMRFDVPVDPDAAEDEIFGAPAAKAQVEPHPQPEPWPEPQPRPEPWPQPEPRPAPWPEPDPHREPTPGPSPEPQPGPEPGPTPGPIPGPDPTPWPQPEPSPQPTPEPEPKPWPEPEPEPAPRPEPEPTPWPDPEPSPQPEPMPRPEPTTHAARHDTPDHPAAHLEDEPEYDGLSRPTGAPARPGAHVEDEVTYDGLSEAAVRDEPAARVDEPEEWSRNGDAPAPAEDARSWAEEDSPGSPATQAEYAAEFEDEFEYERRAAAGVEHAARFEGAGRSGAEGEDDFAYGGAGRGAVREESAGRAEEVWRGGAYEPAAAFGSGFDDDEPTGFIPLVEEDGPGPVGRLGDAADVAAAVRMSIPGLGLVGTDGPRIEVPPGSIEEAMRSEIERPRPRPQESEAFKALHAWCRARTAVVPSGFTIQVQVLDPGAPSYRFDLEPPDVDDPEFGADKLSGLLGDLWISEASGEQGGWLFARIDAAGRTLRIDRWYDQVPDWWDNPVEPRLDVHGLVRRLHDRGPEWQPSYLERLYTTAR